MSEFEKKVILNIGEQIKILAKHGSLQYDKVNETMNKLIDIQTMALSGSSDISISLGVIAEAKLIIEKLG